MSYPCLNDQLCIGGVYVRLLLEGGDASELLGYCSIASGPGGLGLSGVPGSACCLVELQPSRSGGLPATTYSFTCTPMSPRLC